MAHSNLTGESKEDKWVKLILASEYLIHLMYLDRQAWANSVDPDETLHQGLHYLPLIQQFLDTTTSSKLYLFKF